MTPPDPTHPPTPGIDPAAGRATGVAAALGLVAAAQLGCALLLELSQFGQQPLARLPLAEIVFFGALFSAPLLALLRRLRAPAVALTLGLAGTLIATLALAGALGPFALRPAYALAPLTALLLALLFQPLERRAPGRRRGTMLAAMTVYVACTLLANYTFDAFVPLAEVFGFAFPLNVGTLFFGITFTQRDRVHRFGRRAVYAMILTAAGANVITALSLGTPLRYVAVGFLAIVLSETADTEIYGRLLHRPWFTRVASSNAVSAPLDTLLFTVLAFAGESFATPLWMLQVIVTDVLVKYASSLVAALRLWNGRRAAEAA